MFTNNKVLLLPLIVTLEGREGTFGAHFRRVGVGICRNSSRGVSPPSRPTRNHQQPPTNTPKKKHKYKFKIEITPEQRPQTVFFLLAHFSNSSRKLCVIAIVIAIVIVSWAGLGWRRPEARLTLLGWAGLGCTHGRRRD